MIKSANIPDTVTDNIVYRDGDTVHIADTADTISPKLDIHKFVKEVVCSNKIEVFKHLMKNKFKLHYPDLVFLACQHGHLEMTRILMNSKVNILIN